MKLIIDIPEDWEKGIKNMYDWDIANFLYATCRNGTPIPDNATNGDVIKAMFPHYDIEIDEHKGYVRIFYEDFYTTYPWRWWNAPYQKGGKE